MTDVFEGTKIEVLPNGPVKVTGNLQIANGGETVAKNGAVYLCRCGASSKKPYCDGSHTKIGFKTEA